MTPTPRRARRAFTLAEIIVALTILALIGTALVRLIIVQSRFSEERLALRTARTVSRNAMNIMLTDLRMVQDNGGLIAAAPNSVTVRVPIAFGLLCVAGAAPTLSLLPADSAMTALGKYSGWAYRDSSTGVYSYKDASSIIPFNSMTTAVSTLCTDSVTGPGILSLTSNGRTTRVVTLADGPAGPGTPNPGWPVFVYQQVTYKFDSSTAYAGRIGLFRKVKTGVNTSMVDEIIAPFDTSAKFRFYVLNADTAQSAVPGAPSPLISDLATVRGLQLVLTGASPRVPQGSSQPRQAGLVTGVFFKNRRDP
ncbi:MAG TPA: prepilin-type N-terminal cleavage/methylation domain-containing protein [Gemmatimonadaceae bacterium]